MQKLSKIGFAVGAETIENGKRINTKKVFAVSIDDAKVTLKRAVADVIMTVGISAIVYLILRK